MQPGAALPDPSPRQASQRMDPHPARTRHPDLARTPRPHIHHPARPVPGVAGQRASPLVSGALDALHAAAWESGHGYLNTTAGIRRMRCDFEMVLEINIDVHQNPEHDVLVMS